MLRPLRRCPIVRNTTKKSRTTCIASNPVRPVCVTPATLTSTAATGAKPPQAPNTRWQGARPTALVCAATAATTTTTRTSATCLAARQTRREQRATTTQRARHPGFAVSAANPQSGHLGAVQLTCTVALLAGRRCSRGRNLRIIFLRAQIRCFRCRCFRIFKGRTANVGLRPQSLGLQPDCGHLFWICAAAKDCPILRFFLPLFRVAVITQEEV